MSRKSPLAAALVAAGLMISPAWAQQTQPGQQTAPGAQPGYQQPAQPGIQPGQQPMGQQPAGQQQLSSSEERFVKKAIKDNRGEVELGQFAQQRATNPQVKQLAQRIAQDHQQALQQLNQIAQQSNVQITQEKSKEASELREELSDLSGQEFDKKFVKETLDHHKKEVSEFEEKANEVTSPALKQFITSTLPTLREHLQLARQTAQAIGVETEE